MFNFPSRFFKKLDIYQQIRNHEGVNKHKHLWLYEAAFLQTSYGENHGHISGFLNFNTFKEWILYSYSGKDNIPNDGEFSHIAGNLFVKGYIESKSIVSIKKKDVFKTSENIGTVHNIISEKSYPSTNIKILSHIKGDIIPTDKIEESKYEFRVTLEGLIVGEVVDEINNHNLLIRYYNRYKYSMILASIWLVIFFGFMKLLLPVDLYYIINFKVLFIKKIFIIPIIIFILWPLFLFILKTIRLYLENNY